MKTGDVNYIQDILQKKESATLEFKARFDKVECAKVICSFLIVMVGNWLLEQKNLKRLQEFKMRRS